MTVSARGLGGDDGEQDGPGRQVARAEEVVGRAPLVARHPEADAEREDEIEHDDGEVEVCTAASWARSGWKASHPEQAKGAYPKACPLRVAQGDS